MTQQKRAMHIEEWRRQIKEFEASGLSVRKWCKKHGMQRSTFYSRQAKIRAFDQESEGRIRDNKNDLTNSTIPQLTIQHGEIEIHIYKGADPDLLKAAISAITDNPIQATDTSEQG